jgi:diguanylate cyclase (GGDEF)-like protein
MGAGDRAAVSPENDLAVLRALGGLFIPGGVLVAAALAVQHEPVMRNAAAPYALHFAIGSLTAAILLSWHHEQPRLLFAAAAVALTVAGSQRWPAGAMRGDEPSFSLFIWLGIGIAALVLIALVLHRRTRVAHGLLWALVAMFLGMLDPETLLLYSGAAGVILVLTVLEHGYDIAHRDELTGLLGRRAFNSMMGQLGKTYAIAMCDVDRFKNFNDTYGHDAGDQVLRMVATKLSQVGGGGRVFRYGGEEFLVVFRGRSAADALPFAESVRKTVADTRFVLRGPDRPVRKPAGKRSAHQPNDSRPSVGITISIGLAERSHRHSTPELVLDAADAALYQAKEAGRNCVRMADSGHLVPP